MLPLPSHLLFADVFVPHLRMRSNKLLQQFAAFAAVEIDDINAILAEPSDPAREGAALAHDHHTDAKLPHQPAAVPARSERGDHHQIAIASLASGAAKGVRLPVDARVALLHAAIPSATHKL